MSLSEIEESELITYKIILIGDSSVVRLVYSKN